MASNTLPLLPLITSHDVTTRIDATVSLVEQLGPDMDIIIDRLKKGLASDNKSTRVGYAVALSQVLEKEGMSAETALDVVDSVRASNGASKPERKAVLLGRLFGLHSVIISVGLSNVDLLKKYIEMVLGIAKAKSWLRPAAGWLLHEALVRIPEEWRDEAAAEFRNVVVHLGKSAEKIALTIELEQIGELGGLASPLASQSIDETGHTLVSAATASTSVDKGVDVHYVWDVIFSFYGKGHASSSTVSFTKFWDSVVDTLFFGPGATVSIQAAGFMIWLKAADIFDIESLMTSKFVDTLSKYLRKAYGGEKALARLANKVIAKLEHAVGQEPHKGIAIVKKLVFSARGGAYAFNTRLLQRLVAQSDEAGQAEWILFLQDIILGKVDLPAIQELQAESEADVETTLERVEKAVVSYETWALDQLLVAGRQQLPQAQQDDLVAFFVHVGWFDVTGAVKGDAAKYIAERTLSAAVRANARERLYSLITSLSSRSGPSVYDDALKVFFAGEKNPSLALTTGAMPKRSKIYDRAKSAVPGLAVLVSGVLLWSYRESEETPRRMEMLDDCIRALKEGQDPESDDAASPTAVLVDFLLELLKEPSAFVKGFVLFVLKEYAESLDEQAVELMIDAAAPGALDEWNNALADHMEESGSEDAQVSEDDESEEDEDSSEPDSDIQSDAESEAASDSDADEALRAELLKALEEGNLVPVENDQEETEDAVLPDDDELADLDAKLAAIFHDNLGPSNLRRKDRKARARNELHYRLRVLDLVELWARKTDNTVLVNRVVLALFGALRMEPAASQEFVTRSTGILRSMVSRFAGRVDTRDASLAYTIRAFQLALEHALAVTNPQLTPIASQVVFYLAHASVPSTRAVDHPNAQGVAQLYADALSEFAIKKNAQATVQPEMTLEFVKRGALLPWIRVADLIDLVKNPAVVNTYRRLVLVNVLKALCATIAALKDDLQPFKGIIPTIVQEAVALLKEPLESDAPLALKGPRLQEAARCVLAICRATLPLGTGVWEAQDIPALERRYSDADVPGAKSVHNLVKQLSALVANSVSGPKKRKAEDDGKRKKDKKRN